MKVSARNRILQIVPQPIDDRGSNGDATGVIADGKRCVRGSVAYLQVDRLHQAGFEVRMLWPIASGICAGRLVTPATLAKICVSPGTAAVKRACVICLPLLLFRAGSDVFSVATVLLALREGEIPDRIRNFHPGATRYAEGARLKVEIVLDPGAFGQSDAIGLRNGRVDQLQCNLVDVFMDVDQNGCARDSIGRRPSPR